MKARSAAFVLLVACSRAPSPPAAPAAPAVVRLERPYGAPRESGGLVLARVDGTDHAFVADEDDEAILEIDPGANRVVATTSLGTRPRDLLVLADGRLAATLPERDAVVVFERDANAALHEVARAKTPADPIAMAVDSRNTTLYVTTGASHSLLALSSAKLHEQRRLSLGREPRAVLVSSDDKRVFVTHAVEDFVSIVPALGESGSVRNTSVGGGLRTARHAQVIVHTGGNGIVVPVAESLPVPLMFPRKTPLREPKGSGGESRGRMSGYGVGAGSSGPPITAELANLDEVYGVRWNAAFASGNDATCLLPRAGAARADGSLLVACIGSASVVRYVPKGDDVFTLTAEGAPPITMGRRSTVNATAIAMPAGPSAIALEANGDALVWSSFARTLTRIRDESPRPVLAVPRAHAREEAWLRGRELFFANTDKRISSDGRACASCHVDGLDDGLTWATPEGPRRTRFLRGEAVGEGHFGWKGEHATLAEHVRATMKNLGGTGLPEPALADLTAYLGALPKPRSGSDAEVLRGKELFSSAECSHCHTDGGSDRKVHDIGTGGAFMTPTLASAGRRRELMHDGRFKDLDTMLSGSASMGRGSELSPEERRALTLYLETL